MCDPVTIMVGLSVAQGVAGAQAATVGARANAQAMRGNAEIADTQAALDDERAKDALVRGGERIFAKRLTQKQVRGRQKAILAARGLALGEGSAFDILEDTDYLTDIDVSTIQTNAEREAWGFRERAKVGRFKASQLRRGIPTTLMLGQVQAFGQLAGAGVGVMGALRSPAAPTPLLGP